MPSSQTLIQSLSRSTVTTIDPQIRSSHPATTISKHVHFMNRTYTSGQRVHTNTILAPFLGNRATHLVNGCLGGVVGRTCQTAVGDLAGHRGDHDDTSGGVLFLEDTCAVLGWDECSDDAVSN
ncbi:unnamed protein product [Aspergillus oryzae]|nr:unnamed protein product [Aspergillus oryzae]